MAVEAWNMMGGIDWTGLPVVVEYFGITEVDQFISRLISIRDYLKAKNG